MYYSSDWMMRQIQMMVQIVAGAVFGKDISHLVWQQQQPQQGDGQTDLLAEQLQALLAMGQVCKAEDLLFERFDADHPHHLETALVFYHQVNQLSDQQLAAANFSRDEVDQGLRQLLAQHRIDLDALDSL